MANETEQKRESGNKEWIVWRILRALRPKSEMSASVFEDAQLRLAQPETEREQIMRARDEARFRYIMIRGLY